MSDNKQLKIQPLRYITISLLNTNKDLFNLFKSKFEPLIKKAQVIKSDVRYTYSTPYSTVIEIDYLDEAIKLAKELPENSIEISSYELDDEGNRIIDTIEVHYPQKDIYSEELNLLDQEDDAAQFDDDDATIDDDEDNNFNLNFNENYAKSSDEINSNKEDTEQQTTDFYGWNEQINTSGETFDNTNTFGSIKTSTSDESLDELMPTANDILDDLNPTLLDIPAVVNPIVTLTVNQHQSNLYTLYGMLGKTLSNINVDDLTNELDKFKHSRQIKNILEVKNYLASKDNVNLKTKELNDNCDLIKSQYEQSFNDWLNEKIEKLKAEYAEIHPDNTDEEIANYLASNKSTLDKLQFDLNKNKELASQALVREFTVNQENEGLSDALRFVMIKDRAKSAIKSVADAYKDVNTNYLFTNENNTDYNTNQQKFEKETNEYDKFDDVVQSLESDDNFSDNFSDNFNDELVNNINVEENSGDSLDETSNEPDFENMTDDELIEYYNKHMSGNSFVDDITETKEPVDHELSDENVINSEKLDDMFNVETLPVKENKQNLNDEVVDNVDETKFNNELDDGLDLGVTKSIPVISDEDIEEATKTLADETNQNEENKTLTESKVDEPDALKTNDTGETYEFKEISEDVIDFDEVESTLNGSKKKKKKKAKNKKSSKKADDNGKKKSKAPSTLMKLGVIVLFMASIGTVGYFGYETATNLLNKPTITNNKKSATDSKTVKKFFEEAKLYGIDIDKEIVVPIDGSNINVKITALNSDGSITVKDKKGNNYNIPYSKVKAFVDDEKAKYNTSSSSNGN